tara:strand:+ start:265 stop:612 length:348 start_codon:yes stop_codon:yes gene_type:complete
MQENHIFFNKTVGEANATGEGAMYPASAFLGADCSGTRKVALSFKSRGGTAADDVVELTHADVATANIRGVMKQIAAALSNPKGKFQHQSNFVGRNLPNHDGFVRDITVIGITQA